jgi:hypothetical protein
MTCKSAGFYKRSSRSLGKGKSYNKSIRTDGSFCQSFTTSTNKKNGNGGITHTYGIKNGKQFLRRTINNDSI